MAWTSVKETIPPALNSLIDRAVDILHGGGVVAYPTDTLYGLGAHALTERAVERVFRIKGRPAAQPIPLLLADARDMQRVARDIPPVAWELARRFWPGGLTLVLAAASTVPRQVTAGGDTVAVRVPAHPVPRELARRLGAPITGTSANRSGAPGPVTAEEVTATLGCQVDLIIDTGPCSGGLASTVLDLTGDVPRVLRQGPVSMDDLRQVCGRVEVEVERP